jgi:hypothetical protein
LYYITVDATDYNKYNAAINDIPQNIGETKCELVQYEKNYKCSLCNKKKSQFFGCPTNLSDGTRMVRGSILCFTCYVYPIKDRRNYSQSAFKRISKSSKKQPRKSPKKQPRKSPKKQPRKSPKKSPKKQPRKSPKKSPKKQPRKSPKK